MKLIHKINFWTLAINIVLFIVPYFGMAFMMVLGAVQLVLALAIVFSYYNNLDNNDRVNIKIYWLLVAADILAIIAYHAFDSFFNDLFSIGALFLFPGAIAIYFFYITYTITKKTGHDNPAPQH